MITKYTLLRRTVVLSFFLDAIPGFIFWWTQFRCLITMVRDGVVEDTHCKKEEFLYLNTKC